MQEAVQKDIGFSTSVEELATFYQGPWHFLALGARLRKSNDVTLKRTVRIPQGYLSGTLPLNKRMN